MADPESTDVLRMKFIHAPTDWRSQRRKRRRSGEDSSQVARPQSVALSFEEPGSLSTEDPIQAHEYCSGPAAFNPFKDMLIDH